MCLRGRREGAGVGSRRRKPPFGAIRKGSMRVTAPLGLGRRFIASGIPDFHDKYPDVGAAALVGSQCRHSEGRLDVAFRLGLIKETLRCACAASWNANGFWRHRLLLDNRGEPRDPEELIGNKHDCLMLRFPGARSTSGRCAPRPVRRNSRSTGLTNTDDGDVISRWALARPRHSRRATLDRLPARGQAAGTCLPASRQFHFQLAALYPHENLQDPKVRLLLDFMADRCQRMIRGALAPIEPSRLA